MKQGKISISNSVMVLAWMMYSIWIETFLEQNFRADKWWIEHNRYQRRFFCFSNKKKGFSYFALCFSAEIRLPLHFIVLSCVPCMWRYLKELCEDGGKVKELHQNNVSLIWYIYFCATQWDNPRSRGNVKWLWS